MAILAIKSFGINRSPNPIRFAEKLATAECGVVPVRKQGCAKRLAIKKESFDDVINSLSEWYQLQRKVIDPIRKEILENNQASKSTDLVVTKKERYRFLKVANSLFVKIILALRV